MGKNIRHIHSRSTYKAQVTQEETRDPRRWAQQEPWARGAPRSRRVRAPRGGSLPTWLPDHRRGGEGPSPPGSEHGLPCLSCLLPIFPAPNPLGSIPGQSGTGRGVTLRPSSGWLQASFWASRSGNFFGWSGEDSWYSVCVLITTCRKRGARSTLKWGTGRGPRSVALELGAEQLLHHLVARLRWLQGLAGGRQVVPPGATGSPEPRAASNPEPQGPGLRPTDAGPEGGPSSALLQRLPQVLLQGTRGGGGGERRSCVSADSSRKLPSIRPCPRTLSRPQGRWKFLLGAPAGHPCQAPSARWRGTPDGHPAVSLHSSQMRKG